MDKTFVDVLLQILGLRYNFYSGFPNASFYSVFTTGEAQRIGKCFKLKFPLVSNLCTMYNTLHFVKNNVLWPYRLTVRTSDFQSDNPGSIPGGVTRNFSLSTSIHTTGIETWGVIG